MAALDGVDLAEVCITSGIEVIAGAAARRRLRARRRGGRRRGAEAGRRAPSARAPGASPRTSAPIRRSRSSPRATPPPCASSTRGRPEKLTAGRFMHYTVVHEQDEQIRGLQLAPHARAEGGARGRRACREDYRCQRFWSASPRTGSRGAQLAGRRSRAAAHARRADGMRRHHQTGDGTPPRTSAFAKSWANSLKKSCEPAPCAGALIDTGALLALARHQRAMA